MIPLVVFLTAVVVSSALPVMKQESDAGNSVYDNLSSDYWQKFVDEYAGLDSNVRAANPMEGEFSNNDLMPLPEISFEDDDWQKYVEADEEFKKEEDELMKHLHESMDTYVDRQKYLETGEGIRKGQDFNKMRADMMGQDLTLNQRLVTKSPWLNGMSQTKSVVPDFNNMDMNALMKYLYESMDTQGLRIG